MTQKRVIGSGQTGQARQTSATDPRARRNADNTAGDRDLGPGLRIDANGKLSPRVSGAIVLRGNDMDVDAERLLDSSTDASPISSTDAGKLAWTPGDRVDELDIPLAADVPTVTGLNDKLNELISALTRSGQLER